MKIEKKKRKKKRGGGRNKGERVQSKNEKDLKMKQMIQMN